MAFSWLFVTVDYETDALPTELKELRVGHLCQVYKSMYNNTNISHTYFCSIDRFAMLPLINKTPILLIQWTEKALEISNQIILPVKQLLEKGGIVVLPLSHDVLLLILILELLGLSLCSSLL